MHVLGQPARGRRPLRRVRAADPRRGLRRVPGADRRRHSHEPGRDHPPRGAGRAQGRRAPLRGRGRRPRRRRQHAGREVAACRAHRRAARRHHLRRHRPRRDARGDPRADAQVLGSRGRAARARVAPEERLHPARHHRQGRRARRVRPDDAGGVRRPGARQGEHVHRLGGAVARLYRRRLARHALGDRRRTDPQQRHG